ASQSPAIPTRLVFQRGQQPTLRRCKAAWRFCKGIAQLNVALQKKGAAPRPAHNLQIPALLLAAGLVLFRWRCNLPWIEREDGTRLGRLGSCDGRGPTGCGLGSD